MDQSSFKSYLYIPVVCGIKNEPKKRNGKTWTRIAYNKVPGLITWGIKGNHRYIVQYPEISKKYLIIQDGGWVEENKGAKLLEVLAGPFPTLKAAKAMYLLESA